MSMRKGAKSNISTPLAKDWEGDGDSWLSEEGEWSGTTPVPIVPADREQDSLSDSLAWNSDAHLSWRNTLVVCTELLMSLLSAPDFSRFEVTTLVSLSLKYSLSLFFASLGCCLTYLQLLSQPCTFALLCFLLPMLLP